LFCLFLFGGAAAALSSNCIRIIPPNRWMDQASSSAAAPILDFPEPKKKKNPSDFRILQETVMRKKEVCTDK
jgi:hypothetical protein